MNLQTLYKDEIRPKLQKEIGVKSVMAVPQITKVVLDMGIGEAAKTASVLEQVQAELAAITGQKGQVRPASRDISGFGIRRGQPVGLRVTLRGKYMWSFLEKLFKIVLPRIRDFRGVKTASFDKAGNYTLGITEHTIFPEIDLAKVSRGRGLGITIVTSAKSETQAKRLLEELGMPFEKGGK
ncbi:50S ribosomal protein L5 [Candidatus Microgenomates bacterium]|nr:50S ribosomal protein L5 [Candidatus Microgenomates bacterium]